LEKHGVPTGRVFVLPFSRCEFKFDNRDLIQQRALESSMLDLRISLLHPSKSAIHHQQSHLLNDLVGRGESSRLAQPSNGAIQGSIESCFATNWGTICQDCPPSIDAAEKLQQTNRGKQGGCWMLEMRQNGPDRFCGISPLTRLIPKEFARDALRTAQNHQT
jgi:hypothetical protein